MSRSARHSRLPSLALLTLLGGAGIFAIGAGLYGAGRWILFAMESEPASGTVERVDRVRSGSRGISYVPVFRHEGAEGTLITASRSGNGWQRYTPGETVSLRVAANPGRAEADPLLALILPPLLVLPFGAVFLAFSAAPWLGRRAASVILIALWMLAVGVAALWAWSDYQAASNWYRNSAVTDAVVVRHRAGSIARPGGTPPIPTHAPILRFASAAGDQQEVELAQRRGEPSPPLGATLRLRYAVRGTPRAEAESIWSLWRRPIGSAAVLGLLSLGGLAAILYRVRRSSRT